MDGLYKLSEKIRLVIIAITRFSIKEFKNTDLGYKTNSFLLEPKVKVLKTYHKPRVSKTWVYFFMILALKCLILNAMIIIA